MGWEFVTSHATEGATVLFVYKAFNRRNKSLRTIVLIITVLLSAFILVDALFSIFGALAHVSPNAKFVLLLLAVVMGLFSILDLVDLWSKPITLPIISAALLSTAIVWYAGQEGTEAVSGAIRSEETRSTNSGNQMRAVEKGLGISK